MLHSPRDFVCTGLSSCSAKSLFLLALFAGSLSIIVSPASGLPLSTDLKTDNATTAVPPTMVPVEFPKNGALLCATATTISAKNADNSNFESTDMLNSRICNPEEAAIDPESSEEVPDTKGESATVKPTEPSAASASPSTSATPNSGSINPSATGDQVTENVTIEETSTASPSTTNPPVPSSTSTTTTPTATEITSTTIEPTTTKPYSSTSSVSTTSESVTEEETSASATQLIDNGGGGMPTGIIALVTMITFAVIAVVAYVGLIVWRRYLEYRYGNRELLVNDLEFDTNDLRHFEL